MRWPEKPWFWVLAAAFGVAAAFHVACLVSPSLGPPSPAWRHALFVAINGAAAVGSVWRPRGFVIAFAALAAQQVYSHGVQGWGAWRDARAIDWASIVIVLAMPLALAALIRDARDRTDPKHARAIVAVAAAVVVLMTLALLLRPPSSEVDASLSRSPDTTSEIEPHLAVTPSGVVAVAWMGVQGRAADRIGVRFSADRGATWGPIGAVKTPNGGFAADPVLAADASGAVYLAWLGFRANVAAGGEPYDMRVYAAKAAGARFGSPVDVAPAERDTTYDKPSAVVTGEGTLAIAYRYANPTGAGLAVASSPDGEHFRRRVVAFGATFNGSLPHLCAAKGAQHVFVAYFDPLAGVVLRASDDDGETWPDARAAVVSHPGENVAFEAPACVADGEDVSVLYGIAARPLDTGSSSAMTRVAIARSTDAGKTFDPATVVREDDALMMHPALAKDADGALQIVYYAGRSEGDPLGTFRAARVGAASRVVRAPVRFVTRRSDAGWPGDYVGFAWLDGKGYAAHSDNARGESHIVFSSLE